MWKYKNFKTQKNMYDWINKNEHKYQFTEIFVNNGYCLEIKKLKKVY